MIGVHLYGGMFDVEKIGALCDACGIPFIEDTAQAVGSEWKGKKAGTFGKLGCFSFYPTKNLGAFGEAGCIVSEDEADAPTTKLEVAAAEMLESLGRYRDSARLATQLREGIDQTDAFFELCAAGKLEEARDWLNSYDKPFEDKELDRLLMSARLNSLALTAMCHLSLPWMKAENSTSR